MFDSVLTSGATSTTMLTSTSTKSTTTSIGTTTTISQPFGFISGIVTNSINGIINYLFGNALVSNNAPTLIISSPTIEPNQKEMITVTASNPSDQLYLAVFPSSQIGYEGGATGVPQQAYITGTGKISYSVPTSSWPSGTYKVLAGDVTEQPNTETSGTFTINPGSCPSPPAEAITDQQASGGTGSSAPLALDQQYVLAYQQSTTSVDYIVTATIQPEQGNGGADYLINGLSNEGCSVSVWLKLRLDRYPYPHQFVAAYEVRNDISNGAKTLTGNLDFATEFPFAVLAAELGK